MPGLSYRAAATTPDSMSNRKFNIIGGLGAVVSLWLSCVTITDVFGFSVGDKDVMINGSLCNIEASTGVVDSNRDQVLFNEVVPPGQIFLPITVTTAMNVLLNITYIV